MFEVFFIITRTTLKLDKKLKSNSKIENFQLIIAEFEKISLKKSLIVNNVFTRKNLFEMKTFEKVKNVEKLDISS